MISPLLSKSPYFPFFFTRVFVKYEIAKLQNVSTVKILDNEESAHVRALLNLKVIIYMAFKSFCDNAKPNHSHKNI